MPHHVIQRQTFDTLLSEGLDHQVHYQKLKYLIEIDIQRLLVRILDECFPEDHLVKINQLEVDLGFIPFDNLEQELPKRLEAALQDALSPYLRPHIFRDSTQSANADHQIAKALSLFLARGLFPWWIGDQFKHQRNQHYRTAILSEGAGTAEILAQLQHSPAAQKRLVHQFEEMATILTIRSVEPVHADFIEQYARDLLTFQLEEQIVPASFSEFKKMRWELILMYLFVERGSVFNNKVFIKSTLLQLAARYNMDYQALLSILIEKRHRQSPGHKYRSNFPTLLLVLAEESWKMKPTQLT
ncbi:MAG: contractile injection system tape measure protein, partial [Bacteroidota bacterium]